MPILAFYLLKVILCSAILFGYYHLFLRNKVYHAYNRFYLLAAVAISLLAPVINFNLLFNSSSATGKTIQLLQVVNSGDEYLEEVILYSHRNHISLSQVLIFLYIMVSLFFLFVLIRMLIQIVTILKANSSRRINDVVFVESHAKGTPFSFFKFIFWNNAIDINSETGQQIFAHELAHVREKHSADKLFLNLVLIACWINPIFWLIKKELNLIHEFIADKKAVANNDAKALAAMIVTSAYPKHAYLLTNHFFYSPIKRRLQMLSRYNTKSAGYFYRIMALPVVLFLVAAFTVKTKAGIENLINPAKKITVLIDAGHGGQDNGAMALDRKTFEKDINLAFVKKIKLLNTSANINIILTREEDIYQTPQEKAAITKKSGADLFISIHAASGPFETATKTGLEVFVARDEFSNSMASKLFASSVIANFKSTYGLAVAENPIQRKIGVHVLQQTTFPSILIETGYLSNKNDLAYLLTENAKETFAKNLLNAIALYADNMSSTITSQSALTEARADTVPNASDNAGYYKGEKIKNVRQLPNCDVVELITASGKIFNMSKAKAKNENILLPPPAPAAPAPAAFKNLNENNNIDASQQVTIKTNENGPFTDKKHHPASATNPGGTGETSIKLKTLLPDQQPLVILNGKEIAHIEMNKINPNNIEAIDVFKGEAAVKKYGAAKTANGVIEITTKTKNNIYLQSPPIIPSEKQQIGNEKIFTKVEYEAEFPGGSSSWIAYLRKNLNATMPVDEGWSEGTFTVIIRFIVAKDGSISDVIAENYTGSKTAQMCIDLIKNGPKWKSAKQNGRIVTSYKKQPLTFVVAEQ